MPRGQLRNVVDYLRGVASGRAIAEGTDGELLERFVRRKDEAAFETLLRRHGPMVLAVCRRVLGDIHDAEDAFQAAFLVLVCKGASVRPRGQVGNWLHGVAQRTALEARRLAARRRDKEAKVVPRTETQDDVWSDLRPRLDEEIAHLPDKYRAVLILCDLQEKTRKEAAEQLGVAEGTVASRLARARGLLAKRLTRHGLAVTGGALVTMLSAQAAPVCVPAILVGSTMRAATLFAAGKAAAAGAMPAKVAALTEGVVKTMLLSRLKSVAVAMLLVCVLSAGGGWLVSWLWASKDAEQSKPIEAATDKPKDDKTAIQGVWRIVALEVEGQNEFDPKAENPRLTFMADKLTLKPEVPGHGVRLFQGSYKLDATKKPKTLDITRRGPHNEKWTLQAIYSLDGDVLKICYRLLPPEIKHRDQMVNRRRPFDVWDYLAPGGRPKELATKEGSKTLLVTLKREAANRKAKPKEEKP